MKDLLLKFTYLLVSFLRVIKNFSLHNTNSINIQNFKNELCILGNGPSLHDSLNHCRCFIEKRDVMCVNNFVVSDEFLNLKPKYYLLLDPAWYSKNVSKKLIEIRINMYEQLNLKTTWELYLLLPMRAKQTINLENIVKNKNIRIVYFNPTPLVGFKRAIYFLFRHNLGMPQAYNVLMAAVFLAINLRYKKVFLFGADHSLFKDIIVGNDNIVYKLENHFYDSKNQALVPYEKGTSNGDTFKMHEMLGGFSRVFKGYFDLKDYADSMNVDVYNASTKSYIDAFERIEISNDYCKAD